MPGIKERLAALNGYMKNQRTNMTVFILEDGTEFHTPLGDFEYLYRYGAVTPEGKRIVSHPHPVKGIDDLSLSLYELIDEAIKVGRLELPDLNAEEENPSDTT